MSSGQKQYKAIIFDLGKVVFDYSFDNTFNFIAALTGKDFSFVKNNFPLDDQWELFEKGLKTPQEISSHVSACIQHEISLTDFEKAWDVLYLDLYSGMEELLVELKRNYRVIALTNTNEIHAKVWRKKYANALSHFEKILSSHELKMRKPEKEIYQAAIDFLGMNPQEIIFLDDLPENIKAANEMGITGIQVFSFEQMKGELKERGVLI
ncbi:MAG: HAD family phosphatase [Bacteroidia bacterium]|nr:HAD family phosphatase [Bacteroidia bacterium]